jgi:hypothetical protein
MKAGAADLIGELYGNQEVVKNLWVGLVPFTTTVNVGRARTGWLASYAPEDFKVSPLGWKGCIEERVPKVVTNYGSPTRDTTDDPPGVETWRPFLYRSSDIGNENNRYPTVTEVENDDGHTNDGRGPNRSCPPPVTPLVSPKSALLDAIDAMGAFSSTSGTMNHVGLVWGWRMLSPRWRGLWGGEMNREGLPTDYGDPKRSKAIVILTDGENRFLSNTYTSYGRADEHRLVKAGGDVEKELNRRLTKVCDAVKAQGILIYTITFGQPAGSDIAKLFAKCATKPEYHFDSQDSAGLRRAFRTIGGQLASLRVSQ